MGVARLATLPTNAGKHYGLHLLEENNYLRFSMPLVGQVDPGQTGLITVTNLNNRVMPLIRYQLGVLGGPPLLGTAAAAGACHAWKLWMGVLPM